MLVSGMEQLMSLRARGQFGFTAGLGMARCGRTRCAASKRFGGIYSVKKTLRGKEVSRMRYYRPTNPRTVAQQSWRSVFASGKSAYDALDAGEKVLLSKEARKYGMTGYNLFMSRWLQSHRA